MVFALTRTLVNSACGIEKGVSWVAIVESLIRFYCKDFSEFKKIFLIFCL